MTAFQKSGRGSNDPSLAVDGDTRTCSSTKSNSSDNTSTLYNWQILTGSSPTLLTMQRCTVLKVHGDRLTSVCDGAADTPNLSRYVAVLNTHAAVVLCEFRILSCAKFRFGEDCEMACHCRDFEEECDILDGSCRSGCRDGWYGEECQLECQTGYYGPLCMSVCGYCRHGEACDPRDGKCIGGCDPGWSGDKCDQACVPGYYGDGCVACGFCAGQLPCDVITGECQAGCVTGFDGNRCDMAKEFIESSNNYLDYVLPINLVLVGGVLTFVLFCFVVKSRREELYPYPHTRLPE
ncbi:multiple epidermal growth factor-like domains protein 11 [Pecten maximus]|uniref:multiple epidermal growth factor-like domains protein 11 n=1 Tax=Pecten maximus TaxID=6579 RepID=UPI0014584783|nr:multiple epidermal growth factor-like domains protein 11 [Pecten maximus]